MNDLHKIVEDLVRVPKGILAADESLRTAKKRLDSIGMEDTEENRRLYRELFFTTPGIEDYLSGVILFDETFGHATQDGEKFVDLLKSKSIIPGIKVDMGTADLEGHLGEVYTQGLDDLAERLTKYVEGGAKFTKWRAVTAIDEGNGLPSDEVIKRNMKDLAEFAAICQEAGLVPIVEPEVLLTGKHGIEKAEEVTKKVLRKLVEELKARGVDMAGTILKTSMVVPGDESGEEMNSVQVAEKTVPLLQEVLAAGMGGIVFLSGGQTPDQATDNLREISELAGDDAEKITFSFSRALQGEALAAWGGKQENWEVGQDQFLKRLKEVSGARVGE